MFNEKMPARILAQCLVCSEHLVNVIYEDYGLLVTFIHCGMQKVAVDSEMKISWFSFCMSTCCDKYKRNSPCIHSFVHPSFPSASVAQPFSFFSFSSFSFHTFYLFFLSLLSSLLFMFFFVFTAPFHSPSSVSLSLQSQSLSLSLFP